MFTMPDGEQSWAPLIYYDIGDFALFVCVFALGEISKWEKGLWFGNIECNKLHWISVSIVLVNLKNVNIRPFIINCMDAVNSLVPFSMIFQKTHTNVCSPPENRGGSLILFYKISDRIHTIFLCGLSKIYIFQNCQMETAKEGNLLHSMEACSLGQMVTKTNNSSVATSAQPDTVV